MTALIDEKLNRLSELLPWYINRSLDPTTHREVEQTLSSSPELRGELGWLESLKKNMSESVALPANDIGLDRLHALIKAERNGKVLALPSRRQAWRRPLLAIAATIMLAQAAVIGVLMKDRMSPDTIAPLSASPTATSPANGEALLQVVFREAATEAQIRAALNAVHGELVAGPGAVGVYTVRVSAADADNAVTRLRAEAGVDSATRLDRQP